MPTRDDLVEYAAMIGLYPRIGANEISLRLSRDAADRAWVYFASSAWVVAGPGDTDPRNHFTGWHEALKEARTRLRAC
jgi:hypothetical protein